MQVASCSDDLIHYVFGYEASHWWLNRDRIVIHLSVADPASLGHVCRKSSFAELFGVLLLVFQHAGAPSLRGSPFNIAPIIHNISRLARTVSQD